MRQFLCKVLEGRLNSVKPIILCDNQIFRSKNTRRAINNFQNFQGNYKGIENSEMIIFSAKNSKCEESCKSLGAVSSSPKV